MKIVFKEKTLSATAVINKMKNKTAKKKMNFIILILADIIICFKTFYPVKSVKTIKTKEAKADFSSLGS